MSELISIDEVIAEGQRLIALNARPRVVPGDQLKDWYDRLLAERTARRNQITIADRSKIEVGKTYDLTIQTYNTKHPQQLLSGWVIDCRAGYADQYVQVHKRGPVGREWQGARRQLDPGRILSAVEVPA